MFGEFVDALQSMLFTSLISIGLVGVILVRGWDWAAPIAAVSLLSALLMSTRIASRKLVSSSLFIGLLPATWWALNNRSQFWWRISEGIPFDETILESISKSLIKWGPTTNPLHHGLDGASAAAYHHLLYFIIGLIDRFAHPGPYEALLLLAPIISGFSICLSLVLLVRVLLRELGTLTKFSPTVLVGLIGCLFGLRGEGFGSPSTWFGIASLIASLLIIVGISQNTPNYRQLFLIAFSVLTVAFSKGIFIYASVLISISLAMFDWKTRWKIAVTTLIAGAGIVTWFSWASVVVDQFSIEFWPYRNLQSQFAFNFYTFRVFFNQLISPVILGMTCAAMLRYSKQSLIRQIGFSQMTVLLAAVVSQLFITSTGARSFELLFVPGIVASSVLILILAVSTNNYLLSQFRYVFIAIAAASCIIKYAPPIGNGTINPFTIATTFVVVLVGFVWLSKKFGWVNISLGANYLIPLTSVFLSLVAAMTFLSLDFPSFPQYSRKFVESQSSNWLGSPDFIEIVGFIQEETEVDSLFAYSICNRTMSYSCKTDFRPAALTGRRFLALEPLFSQEAVNNRVWSDIELSKAIGSLPPSEIIHSLTIRRVNYVLLDSSTVKTEWILGAIDAGAVKIFSNTSYYLIRININ